MGNRGHVVAAQFPPAGAEQFEFGAEGDKAFDGVSTSTMWARSAATRPAPSCDAGTGPGSLTSATETSNLRLTSAISGRTTERFSFRL